MVTYQDGSEERIEFFASPPRYFRISYVRVVPDETVEAIFHSVVDAYEDFGDIPLVGVFDNPRTVVPRSAFHYRTSHPIVLEQRGALRAPRPSLRSGWLAYLR